MNFFFYPVISNGLAS